MVPEKYSSLPVGEFSFEIQYLAVSKTGMVNLHAGLDQRWIIGLKSALLRFLNLDPFQWFHGF